MVFSLKIFVFFVSWWFKFSAENYFDVFSFIFLMSGFFT
jgi:hypothetical protein